MANDTEIQKTNRGGVLVVSWIHVVILLVFQLAALVVGYGELKQSVDDVRADSKEFVRQKEFDSWREDVRDSLQRIESEIIQRNQMERDLK